MKHFIISTILFITLPSMMFASDSIASDTIAVIENAGNITIKNAAEGTTITITDQDGQQSYFYQFSSEENDGMANDDWNLNLPFLKEKKKKRRDKFECSICVNPYIGVSTVSDKPAGLHGSIECGLSELLRAEYYPGGRGFSINIGFGLGYRLYTLGAGNRFSSSQRRLSVEKADEGMSDLKNRLNMFGFHLPVMLKQRIGKHFAIAAGAWLNFNTYTTASCSYDSEDLHYNESYKGLHQKLMTVDFVGKIGFPDAIGLYVRYSPMKPFDNGYGPQFKTLSFGITLGF